VGSMDLVGLVVRVALVDRSVVLVVLVGRSVVPAVVVASTTSSSSSSVVAVRAASAGRVRAGTSGWSSTSTWRSPSRA